MLEMISSGIGCSVIVLFIASRRTGAYQVLQAVGSTLRQLNILAGLLLEMMVGAKYLARCKRHPRGICWNASFI